MHEKAILIPLIPLSLTALDSTTQTKIFLLLSPFATSSFIPLIPDTDIDPTQPILLLLIFSHVLLTMLLLHDETRYTSTARRIKYTGLVDLFSMYENIHLWGLALLRVITRLLPLLLPHLPFLPLMIISTYLSTGYVVAWIEMLRALYVVTRLVESYEDNHQPD